MGCYLKIKFKSILCSAKIKNEIRKSLTPSKHFHKLQHTMCVEVLAKTKYENTLQVFSRPFISLERLLCYIVIERLLFLVLVRCFTLHKYILCIILFLLLFLSIVLHEMPMHYDKRFGSYESCNHLVV